MAARLPSARRASRINLTRNIKSMLGSGSEGGVSGFLCRRPSREGQLVSLGGGPARERGGGGGAGLWREEIKATPV